ncbi:hypothetical protein DRQ50_08830 [bacterium]|nr:MAG: hypothetical protein DRQ50_08830 [bacterium]
MGLSILKRVGMGVGLATIMIIAVGLFLPRTYTIERSIVITATQQHIHDLCGDLEQWPRWTPWFKADPGIEITMGGLTSGEGAHQTWHGKGSRGELTFTRSDPDWGVGFDLRLNGGSTDAVCTMRYALVDSGVRVTWDMTGDAGYNLLDRFFGLMMDTVIGPMFDEGLTRLKLVAEEAPAEDPGISDLG